MVMCMICTGTNTTFLVRVRYVTSIRKFIETPARLDRTPFTHTRDSGYVLMCFIITFSFFLTHVHAHMRMPRSVSRASISKERREKKHNFQNHFSDVLKKLNTNRKEMLECVRRDERVGQCVETS